MRSTGLRVVLALRLATLVVATCAEAAAPAGFAGFWEDCTSFPGTCLGYRLSQEGDRVCGSMSEAPLAGVGPRQHGHIRGVVRGNLLGEVSVCGVESRSACPTILFTNRRGLLRCGDALAETGGRRYTCQEWAATRQPSPYQPVGEAAFEQRFGPPPPSLCEVPVTREAGAPYAKP